MPASSMALRFAFGRSNHLRIEPTRAARRCLCGTCTYHIWGEADLDDAAWSEVETGEDGNYRFFRVTVEMP